MRNMCWRVVCACLLFILLFPCEVNCSVIAKSEITICENTAKDPTNVLHNKRCEKKMVVLAEVTGGQGETERLQATVKKIRDTVEEEDARLYNPFIITLSMTPIRLVYPIYHRGEVNNKPYEVMVPTRKYNCAADKKPCDVWLDGWKKLIWDSWGFCCECQRKGMYAWSKMHNFKLTGSYLRGQIDCDKFLSSGHCMRYDDLWYDVHEIDVFSFDFSIWIKAYDQVERFVNNKTVFDWVDGGEIELSPTKTGGVGKHGRIVAKYIGKMKAGNEYPRLQDHYLLTPRVDWLDYYARKHHPQIKHGYDDYLIVPMSDVNLNENDHACDKIGVTFTAFAMQSTFHQMDGYGCYQKQGTCLRNQIQDYFIEDSMRRERGEKTRYFPETYGKIRGLKQRRRSRERVVEFESEEMASVMVHLEISADDLILIYNRAEGIIVKAFAEGFESQTRNGMATVIVQNTGFVTADYYVSMDFCSNSINAGHEKYASINPQTNHEFKFTLESYTQGGGAFSCTANLYDARRKPIDSTIIKFNTTSTCVCILRCGCSCTDQENFVCITESNVTFDQGKPPTYTDFMDDLSDTFNTIYEVVGDVVEGVISVAKGVWGFLPHIGKIWSYLTLIAIIIGLIVLRVLCGFLPTGVFKILAKKTIKAMKSPEKQNTPAPTVVVIQKEESDSDEDEAKKTQEFLGASTEGRRRRTKKDFVFEFFFFFVMPVVLLFKGFKWLWKKTMGPCLNVAFDWLKKQLGHLFKTFYNWIKGKLSNKGKMEDSEYEYVYIYDSADSNVKEGSNIDEDSDQNQQIDVEEAEQNVEHNENVDQNSKSNRRRMASLFQKKVEWLFRRLLPGKKKEDLSSNAVDNSTSKICSYMKMNIENGDTVKHYGIEDNITIADDTVSDVHEGDVDESNIAESGIQESNMAAKEWGGSYDTGSDAVVNIQVENNDSKDNIGHIVIPERYENE